jgi:hypothetical protein
MNEIERLYRQAQWLLLASAVLFIGFGILTQRVEGGAMGVILILVGVACAATGLWLYLAQHPRRKRFLAPVVVVTLAVLVGGVVGHVTDDREPADAHTVQCGSPPAASANAQVKLIYRACVLMRMQHALWHMRHDTMVAVASNIRPANEGWCRQVISHPGSYILYPLCGNP